RHDAKSRLAAGRDLAARQERQRADAVAIETLDLVGRERRAEESLSGADEELAPVRLDERPHLEWSPSGRRFLQARLHETSEAAPLEREDGLSTPRRDGLDSRRGEAVARIERRLAAREARAAARHELAADGRDSRDGAVAEEL